MANHPMLALLDVTARAMTDKLRELANNLPPGGLVVREELLSGPYVLGLLRADFIAAIAARKGQRAHRARMLYAASLLTGDERWRELADVAIAVQRGVGVPSVAACATWAGVTPRHARRIFHPTDASVRPAECEEWAKRASYDHRSPSHRVRE